MMFRPLLGFCLLAAPLFGAEPALLDYLPPEASFAIGVNVRSLVDSPMAKGMAGDVRKASVELNQMMSFIGFDPFQDVEEVLVAAVGEGKKAQGLMLARGRFAALRKKAPGAPYKGVPIQGQGQSAIAYLDSSTLVMGDLPMVRGAIDRRGKPTSSELRGKLAALAATYQIYGFGKIPEGGLPGANMPDAAKGVDQVQIGVRVAKGVDVTAELQARTDADARALAQTLQLVAAMAAQQPGGDAEMMKNLTVQHEGRGVRLTLAVSEADLVKMAEARRNAAAKAQAPTVTASNGQPLTAPPAPAAKAAQRDPRFSQDTVLVITGAESDGGTIVIRDPKKK